MAVRLTVRLTPRAALDRIDGVVEREGATVINARVRAVPEKGQANAALENLIAKAIGVPKSCVQVIAGGTSRLKTLEIETSEPAASLQARLGLHITKS